MTQSNKHSLGITVLEAGLMIVAFGTFIIGAIGILDVMTKSFRVSRLVEWLVTDDSVKPYKFHSDSNGEISLALNYSEMNNYLVKLRDKVSGDLTDGTFHLSNSQYLMQGAYTVLHVNSSTGSAEGIDSIGTNQISIGNEALHTSGPCEDLEAIFSALGSKTRVSEFGETISEYAYPAHERGKYLDSVVLVGLRIFVDVSDEIAGTVLSELGKDTNVSDCKAIVLRGDVQ